MARTVYEEMLPRWLSARESAKPPPGRRRSKVASPRRSCRPGVRRAGDSLFPQRPLAGFVVQEGEGFHGRRGGEH